MSNECCTNELCVKRETKLRLARIHEDILVNFNTLLIDRIRFLEQTIGQLSLQSSTSSTIADKRSFETTQKTDRLIPPASLRRSSSAISYLLPSPDGRYLKEPGAGLRSCPSSVDLWNHNEQQKWFLSSRNSLHSQKRASSEITSAYLCLPMHRQWASSANDLTSSTNVNNEKGRLESRRFACDVDDNELRAFKAMVYMEQARKQHVRPLTRLRQALGISSHSNTTNITTNIPTKKTKFLNLDIY